VKQERWLPAEVRGLREGDLTATGGLPEEGLREGDLTIRAVAIVATEFGVWAEGVESLEVQETEVKTVVRDAPLATSSGGSRRSVERFKNMNLK
jgi:hypothetical protein